MLQDSWKKLVSKRLTSLKTPVIQVLEVFQYVHRFLIFSYGEIKQQVHNIFFCLTSCSMVNVLSFNWISLSLFLPLQKELRGLSTGGEKEMALFQYITFVL